MRPYLAIINDSLREALASRVLWVLIIGVTVVLLGLAPLGYRVDLTTDFLSNSDFYSPKKLALELREGRGSTPSPARAIWSRLDEGQQAMLGEIAGERSENLFRQVGQLRRVLNDVIDGESIHNAEDWKDFRILPAAKELLEKKDELTGQQRKRLNRLLLEGAYPEQFRVRPDETVTITYAMLDFPRTWLPESRLRTVIEDLVLPIVTNFLLGVVAVLIALLVTSTIIPEMFSPGTLHLLLSKPLSRSLIFLSRFFGGCFFVLINVSYLLVGLWVILGLRFGIWNVGLLKCIPLFLFLFIVYYSVAALAGAYWRNAVVAVGVAAGLWGVCFLLGLAKQGLEGSARRASLRQVVVSDDVILGLAENEEVAVWSDADQQWEEVYQGGRIVHGPLLSPTESLIVTTSGGGRGPRFARRSQELSVAVGRASDGWSRESLGNAPERTAGIMFTQDGRLLAVAGEGVLQFSRDLTAKQGGLFGFQLPLPGLAAMAWKKVAGPAEGEYWQPPLAADADPASGDLVVYQRGRVMRFELTENPPDDLPEDVPAEQATSKADLKSTIDLTVEAGVDPAEGVAIRLTTRSVMIALGDGRILFLDRETLKIRDEVRPSRFSQPRSIAVSPSGKWHAVVLQNGKAMVGHEDGELKPLNAPRATAATLTEGSVWVGSDNRSLTEISLESGRVLKEIRPPLDNLQRANRLIVKPLTSVLPMPMDLSETSSYLLSGKQSTNGGLFQGTLDAPTEEIDPWTPVIRCSIFVVVMLSLGCWYIERQEF